jgi:uroporphyrinogen-III synthase
MSETPPDGILAGRRVMVPETRELEVLAKMLERHGAAALRCPLVAIVDAADPAPVEAWLRRFIATPPDDLILLTGEGLSRLLGVAQRAAIEAEFRAALAGVRRIVRGPKPQARLRAIGLSADIAAGEPTTAGVIATLSAQDLRGRRVGVQLYPDNPNDALLDFLRGAGATPDAILPYAYATREDDARVEAMLAEMEAGRIDLAVFTSTPQVKRLAQLAGAERLRAALGRTLIAAVGPLVGQALEAAGGVVSVMPEDSFHMKPMVNAILAAMGAAEPGKPA